METVQNRLSVKSTLLIKCKPTIEIHLHSKIQAEKTLNIFLR